MSIFSTTLNQMLILFLFLFIGYMLKHLNILPENSHIVLAKVENFVIIPSLNLYTFISKCTPENLAAKWIYIVYCLGITAVATLIGLFLSRFFSKDINTRNVYKYSFVIANFGFVGFVLVEGLFGTDTLFDFMLFTLPLQVFIYTIGCVWLIPSQKSFQLKSMINPMFISMLAGAVIGLTGLKLPSFLMEAITASKNCMSPVAMILSGFVIGNYGLKSMLVKKHVYVMSLLRLIVIPAVFYYILYFLGANSNILMLTVCAFAMPLGLNPIIITSAYGGDTTEAASMALISHLMAIVTIPIMFAIFIK